MQHNLWSCVVYIQISKSWRTEYHPHALHVIELATLNIPITCLLRFGAMQCNSIWLGNSTFTTESSIGCSDIIEHKWRCLVKHCSLIKQCIIPSSNTHTLIGMHRCHEVQSGVQISSNRARYCNMVMVHNLRLRSNSVVSWKQKKPSKQPRINPQQPAAGSQWCHLTERGHIAEEMHDQQERELTYTAVGRETLVAQWGRQSNNFQWVEVDVRALEHCLSFLRTRVSISAVQLGRLHVPHHPSCWQWVRDKEVGWVPDHNCWHKSSLCNAVLHDEPAAVQYIW